MISGDKVATIIVQLVAFFDLGSILPKIHMPPEKGPGTKTKRLVFLPLSFMGRVSFFGVPSPKTNITMENPPFEDAFPILGWWFQKKMVIFTPEI